MKKVLIVGSEGNMGSRYRIICNSLGVEVFGIDKGLNDFNDLLKEIMTVDGIIIATPTATHLDFLKTLHKTNLPILCEKPLTTDIKKLTEFFNEDFHKKSKIRMVNQYEYMISEDDIGSSYYNYFKHGSDGLGWDHINIIGLAKGDVQIGENSAVWQCQINGAELCIADMDHAYIAMIEDWMQKPDGDLAYILEAHTKVSEFLSRVRN